MVISKARKVEWVIMIVIDISSMPAKYYLPQSQIAFNSISIWSLKLRINGTANNNTAGTKLTTAVFAK